jgi:hypothetical protein
MANVESISMCILRFAKVASVRPTLIVEQRCRPTRPVRFHSVKRSIQIHRKEGNLFIKVNEMGSGSGSNQGCINPCARQVEMLVAEDFDHPLQLEFSSFLLHFCDKVRMDFYYSSFTRWNLRLYQAFRKSRSLVATVSGSRSTSLWCKPRRKLAQPM